MLAERRQQPHFGDLIFIPVAWLASHGNRWPQAPEHIVDAAFLAGLQEGAGQHITLPSPLRDVVFESFLRTQFCLEIPAAGRSDGVYQHSGCVLPQAVREEEPLAVMPEAEFFPIPVRVPGIAQRDGSVNIAV